MKEKLKKMLKKTVSFLLNPRLLLCFGIAWLITNGWSYILFFVGTSLEIPWMIAVASAYLAFLWVPFTPEKLVTLAIAIFLLKVLFPNDEKTLGILKDLHVKLKEKIKGQKEKRAAKKKKTITE